MTTPLVLPEPLGGGPLAAATLAGRTPDGWFLPRPHTAAGWREHLDAIRAGHTIREWAAALAPALTAGGAAAARLARVAEGRGVVVTTGQQPGLFGGPLYTWFKALSALALADAIEGVTGIPAAPVFWAATDDADFAEGASTWVAGRGGGAWVSLPVPDGDLRPLADVPLGDVSEQLDALTRGTGAAAAPEVLELVRRCYASDTTVGGAYLSLLRAILEPLGIAVLDAAHPSVGATAAPLLRKALRDASRVEGRLVEREREILAAGFVPQVPSVPDLSLVFLRAADGTKARVPIAEAGAVAAKAPAMLGPNVLLRPVMERHLLPTAAYVAGPGEIAYFAQVSAVSAALDQPTPLVVPRWSGTIIEPHIQRLLARYDLRPADLRDPHAVETRLASAAMPPEVAAALGAMRRAVDEGARALAMLDGDAAVVPAAVPEGAARQLHHRLDRLERRYVAAVKRRDSTTAADLGTLRGALYPDGVRQERALNFMPLLARHGASLVDRLRAATADHAARLVAEELAGGTGAARATTGVP